MSTPTSPGLYLDAVGEVWRVHAGEQPAQGPTFDELLEQAVETPAALAARSGPFTPLLALPVRKQDLLLEAIAALHTELSEHGRRYTGQLLELEALSDEIEALG